MALEFKKQIPKKSYEHVVEQIEAAILNQKIQAGERLPPELKLKDMFETSRGTVREALRVLEQKGLVSIKTGAKGGATVKTAGTGPIRDSLGLLIRHQQVSLDHLAQFRILLEGFVAEQAALNATAKDIRILEKLVEKIEKHVNTQPDGFDDFNALDARFHRELARISKNPLIQANLKAIHENIQSYFHDYLSFSPELLKEDYKDLYDILSAIKSGNAHLAGMLARNHVKRFNRIMHQNIKNDERK